MKNALLSFIIEKVLKLIFEKLSEYLKQRQAEKTKIKEVKARMNEIKKEPDRVKRAAMLDDFLSS